jgi:hypothetical protein
MERTAATDDEDTNEELDSNEVREAPEQDSGDVLDKVRERL